MGLIRKVLTYSEDEIREIRIKYQPVKLKQDQIKQLQKEIEVKNILIDNIRLERNEVRDDIMEEYNMSYHTLWIVGERYARRGVR